MTEPLLDALGRWSLRDGSLHARLAAALREAIERGAVADGSRIPAERALARVLGVSRSTVAAAYAALARDGLLEGRRGSGTYVRHRAAVLHLARPAGPEIAPLLLSRTPESVIDLRLAVVEWPRTLRAEALASLAEADVFESEGYYPAGLPSLRCAVAAHLAEAGLPTSEEQVIVTSGAQQAITLVTWLFARRGGRVAVESATFPGAAATFGAAGAHLVPVSLDEGGARLDGLRAAAEVDGACLAYLIPTFQAPTGTVMPESRRRQLARLSSELELPVIDDCTMADLWLDVRPPPPVAAFARDAPVLTVGSMSKLVWAGLRVGWVRAPEPLVSPLSRLKVAADLGTSAVSQALAARLLVRAEEYSAFRRRELSASAAMLEELLSDLLPDWEWRLPAGGLVLWVRLPYGDADEFAQVALRHGVEVLPGSAVSVPGQHRDHLRLPLLRDPDALAEGVRRLARAWDDYRPALEGSAQPLSVVV